VYIRLAREKTPLMTTTKTPFEFGKVLEMWKEKDPEVAIFATGPLLYNALMAAQRIREELFPVTVVNVHTIKPLDTEAVIKLAKKAKAVVTVEEHQIAGGLGSAIAEVLSANCAVPIEFIGVHDSFGQSGEPSELIEHYGMGVSHIIEAVHRAKKRRIK
jgi:transketolase